MKGLMRQNDVYNMATRECKRKFQYMAVFDADEFLFIRKNNSADVYEFMRAFMKEHPNAGGLGANWLVFGSNGHKTKPAGGVLENYTMCAEKNFYSNHYIKTICDPSKVLYWADAHYCVYRKGFYNLDENGQKIIHSLTKEVNFAKIRVNHYFSKSREEWIKKRERGMVAYIGKIDLSSFEYHDQNIIHDDEILSRA